MGQGAIEIQPVAVSTSSKRAGFRAVRHRRVRPIYCAWRSRCRPSSILATSRADDGRYMGLGRAACPDGKNVHLSGGVGIGGVLELMQAGPTIIEDNCFIGARSESSKAASCEGSVLACAFIGNQPRSSTARQARCLRRGASDSVVVADPAGKPLPNGEPGPSLIAPLSSSASTRRPVRRHRSTSFFETKSSANQNTVLLAQRRAVFFWLTGCHGRKFLRQVMTGGSNWRQVLGDRSIDGGFVSTSSPRSSTRPSVWISVNPASAP